MDVFSRVLLTTSIVLPALALCWAIGIFIWGVRSGGNWRNPLIMFEYFADLFFHRLSEGRRARRRQLTAARVPAAPDRVSAMSSAENEFFFLHEVGLETKLELRMIDANEVAVTKREYRRLVEYFKLASKVTNPRDAFAAHGLTLRVSSAPAGESASASKV